MAGESLPHYVSSQQRRKYGSCNKAVDLPRDSPTRRVDLMLANDRDTRKSIALPDSNASPLWILSPSCGSVKSMQNEEGQSPTAPLIVSIVVSTRFRQSNLKADCDQ